MRTVKTLIRLGRCPGWSESSLGAHAILLVLSWGGSYVKAQRLALISFHISLWFQLNEKNTELALFVNLNLAIVYLRTNRQQELMGLLHMIDPEKVETRYDMRHVTRKCVFGVCNQTQTGLLSYWLILDLANIGIILSRQSTTGQADLHLLFAHG